MLRFATLAAVAAVLVAGPAAAADSIHITTAGKTPEQLKAEIQKAAVKVCDAEVGRSLLAYYLQTPCVKNTVKAAIAQADPAVLVASR